VKKLLRIAVTDNVDDVRRAAVISLGFVLCGYPELSIEVLQLLEDSYNPHVRYGVALALGIACAGTGSIDAINSLKPLTVDPEGFVRQGALIASALILVQQTENTHPKVKEFTELYEKILRDRYAPELTKLGAILAQGIINSGGRNVTITSKSRAGHIWAQGVVGLFLFTHYWYWYPMALCLPLAFAPTCVIAVNKNLKVPELSFTSHCKPSLFAYPKPIDRSSEKVERKRCSNAILSFAFRNLAKRLKISDKEIRKFTGELDSDKEKEKPKPPQEKPAEALIPEPNSHLLRNPARCLKEQLKYLEWGVNNRWEPVNRLAVNKGGFVVLKDLKPEAAVVEVEQPSYDPALQIENVGEAKENNEEEEIVDEDENEKGRDGETLDENDVSGYSSSNDGYSDSDDDE